MQNLSVWLLQQLRRNFLLNIKVLLFGDTLLLESLENRYVLAQYKLQFVSVNCKRCTIFSVQIIFLFARSLNINASTSDLSFLRRLLEQSCTISPLPILSFDNLLAIKF